MGREARRLWLCLGVALGVHAACLTYPLTLDSMNAPQVNARHVEVRLLSQASLTRSSRFSDEQDGELDGFGAQAQQSRDDLRRLKPRSEPPEPPAFRSGSRAELPGPGQKPAPGTAGQYSAAEALDESPRLQVADAATMIHHPDDNLPEGQGQTTAALLINAQGGVDAVLVPAEQLPRRFIKAIQSAFQDRTFLPGRAGGLEQAARLCISVQFREGEEPRWSFLQAQPSAGEAAITAATALASCVVQASAR